MSGIMGFLLFPRFQIFTILVQEDRYGSPLTIDTTKVPVALRFTSKCRFSDFRVTKKNRILQIFADLLICKFPPKILQYAILSFCLFVCLFCFVCFVLFCFVFLFIGFVLFCFVFCFVFLFFVFFVFCFCLL